ncbi:phosphoadenylyl-sulfate reductase [Salinibacillus kushneri]|uniref:phosphoadenylyl-sulfate reductase n=1 Tax=Salinibacillus kushneri TaxID=237682 RepID=UPI003CCBD4E2
MQSNSFSYDSLKDSDYQEIHQCFSQKTTLDLIHWAYHTFGDDLVYSCSFGAESMVLIDLIYKVEPKAKLVFLDTDFHFRETYQLIEKVKEIYPELNIEFIKPELTPTEQAKEYGDKLWETNPDLCCQIRKIDPLKKVLSNTRAWISGLRRDQSPLRAGTNFVNKDDKFQSIKICPLIYWTWDEIWDYIKAHHLPYNELHNHHFPSIGCTYCTIPTTNHADSRAGRWAGQTKTECGLHY